MHGDGGVHGPEEVQVQGVTLPLPGVRVFRPSFLALPGPWQPGGDQPPEVLVRRLVDLVAVAVVDFLGGEMLIAQHDLEARPSPQHG